MLHGDEGDAALALEEPVVAIEKIIFDPWEEFWRLVAASITLACWSSCSLQLPLSAGACVAMFWAVCTERCGAGADAAIACCAAVAASGELGKRVIRALRAASAPAMSPFFCAVVAITNNSPALAAFNLVWASRAALAAAAVLASACALTALSHIA